MNAATAATTAASACTTAAFISMHPSSCEGLTKQGLKVRPLKNPKNFPALHK
jgi:hypothetical protein